MILNTEPSNMEKSSNLIASWRYLLFVLLSTGDNFLLFCFFVFCEHLQSDEEQIRHLRTLFMYCWSHEFRPFHWKVHFILAHYFLSTSFLISFSFFLSFFLPSSFVSSFLFFSTFLLFFLHFLSSNHPSYRPDTLLPSFLCHGRIFDNPAIYKLFINLSALFPWNTNFHEANAIPASNIRSKNKKGDKKTWKKWNLKMKMKMKMKMKIKMNRALGP